ncbi:transposon Ty3-I Gag-Pol polyprotein [Trichonephila clavipes]|nr:transposon Ty3-I Gag-Pol polyprotein [Trichonephila clavipes]
MSKVIAYASRTLTKPKRIIPPQKGNVLPSYGLPTNFGSYIFGKHFTVVTDHHSLCWLMNLKDPSGRLARWALRLQEHDFDKKYKTAEVDEISEEIVLRHGAPRVIITDRGAVFDPDLFPLSSTCVTLIIVSQRRIIPKQMD